MAFEPADLWSAWTACRSAWERQLFSDPLLHAEFELADVPPGSDVTPERVEVVEELPVLASGKVDRMSLAASSRPSSEVPAGDDS